MTQKLAILLLLTSIALPCFAVQRVTVEQLDLRLDAARGDSDSSVAHRLIGLQLTERVSSQKLAKWKAGFPGTRTRLSLTALSDASQFLDLPAADIPDIPKPSMNDQHQWMASTVQYVIRTLTQLPNFFARRDVTNFEDTPASLALVQSQSAKPIHRVDHSSAIVLYRDGHEQLKEEVSKHKRTPQMPRRLVTSGEFGLIIRTVIVDASHGRIQWGHWEQDSSKSIAVFDYSVPKDKSHYAVNNCCSSEEQKRNPPPPQFPGYHGQLFIDPRDGTILRLTLQADLDLSDPIVRADIAVEYGPVDIGGKSYICPLKSISLSQGLAVLPALPPKIPNHQKISQLPDKEVADLYKTSINDVIFTEYHRFRSEVRMLSDEDSSETDPKPEEEKTPVPVKGLNNQQANPQPAPKSVPPDPFASSGTSPKQFGETQLNNRPWLAATPTQRKLPKPHLAKAGGMGCFGSHSP